MSTSLQTIPQQVNLSPIIALVLDTLTSHNSKRAYKKRLTDFLTWYDASGQTALTKAAVNQYRAMLLDEDKSASSVNLALSAIRKLASEASDNGLIDPTLAAGIAKVKGVSVKGVRAGNWLTQKQAQDLIRQPDTSKLKGMRDRSIIAVMLGSGLRRFEIANLTYDDIQQRDGRWVIVDLVGKGNRVRTVPIPSWVKVAIDEWRHAASYEMKADKLMDGNVFLPVNKGGRITGTAVSTQLIYRVVDEHATAAGFDIAAHDLRRTFAKLSHKGGAALDQIQLTLGHASVQTTERYLGVEQNLTNAPCDVIGLGLL